MIISGKLKSAHKAKPCSKPPPKAKEVCFVILVLF